MPELHKIVDIETGEETVVEISDDEMQARLDEITKNGKPFWWEDYKE